MSMMVVMVVVRKKVSRRPELRMQPAVPRRYHREIADARVDGVRNARCRVVQEESSSRAITPDPLLHRRGDDQTLYRAQSHQPHR